MCGAFDVARSSVVTSAGTGLYPFRKGGVKQRSKRRPPVERAFQVGFLVWIGVDGSSSPPCLMIREDNQRRLVIPFLLLSVSLLEKKLWEDRGSPRLYQHPA